MISNLFEIDATGRSGIFVSQSSLLFPWVCKDNHAAQSAVINVGWATYPTV